MKKKILFYACTAALAVSLTGTAYASNTAVPAETTVEVMEEADAAVPEETAIEDGETSETEETEESLSDTDNIVSITDETEAEIETTAEMTPASEEETEEETEEEDSIILVDDSRLDSEGRVPVSVTFPEDAVFPYSITLTGSEGDVSFEIASDGQQLLIKPDTYTVKSAKNGKNKKLDKGATLQIEEDTEVIYLDFTNPNGNNTLSELKSILLTNVCFVLIAGIAWMLFKKYKRYLND